MDGKKSVGLVGREGDLMSRLTLCVDRSTKEQRSLTRKRDRNRKRIGSSRR